MKQKPDLVDLPELRRLIAELKLSDDSKNNEYIQARWLKYIEWWDGRAKDAKTNYQRMRSAVIIAGALIPALVGLRELNVLGEYAWIFAVLSIIASLVVAICSGFEGSFNYNGIWREKRAAAEIIKSEGFSFLQLIGDYKDFGSHKEAFKTFAENVENLIRHEIKDYIIATGSTPPKGSGTGEKTIP